MSQGQEHVATLCAVGTVGIAATGFALGTAGGETFLVRPGKRKAPGEDTVHSPRPSSILFLPRRAISQPLQTSAPEPKITRTPSTSLFRRKPFREAGQDYVDDNSQTQSRASSLSRHGLLRPFSRTRDTSAERKESRPTSSWIKRMSMISILDHDDETSSVSKSGDDSASSRPQTRDLSMPNKLVKRAASVRAFSTDQAQGSVFRKPATSHQRPVASSPVLVMNTEPTLTNIGNGHVAEDSPATIWRPFFESGYSRKRHTSGSTREETIRTISIPFGRKPTLLNGRQIQRGQTEDDTQQPRILSSPLPLAPLVPRRRTRTSLGSVRQNGQQRNFTEPVVHVSRNEVYGSILPTRQPSALSPLSNTSTFDVQFSHSTPASGSSAFTHNLPTHPSPMVHDMSIARSDPTTASSDNDVRVFTDDDSMDFHSDTAYDSLATRATASSHSGYRQPKINTIFDDPATMCAESGPATLKHLMRDSSPDRTNSHIRSGDVGIGITGLGNHFENDLDHRFDPSRTPVKTTKRTSEDISETPVPLHIRREVIMFDSSPPTSVRRYPEAQKNFMEGQFADHIDAEDEEEIDWSPKSEKDLSNTFPEDAPSSPIRFTFDDLGGRDSESTKRLSIFDWSEQQKSSVDNSSGMGYRPKTVHGKQGNENGRSRPVARKPPNSVHLRSQSVPVNRDSLTDADLPSSAVKFGTWGLGKKPVSEEWSDDFEFDDDEGDGIKELEHTTVDRSSKLIQRDSIRSVRVPQAIIDRQASVHLQFGQVQEFMLLVEELKRLRAHGVSLQLLEGYSKHLWDDAENIVNLATLNDEDDGAMRPPSPTSSDVFADDKEFSSRDEDAMRNALNSRAISNPITPPFGRARGESLAQAKSFLQTIHQNRSGNESSPIQLSTQPREKLPFDSQDLRDLVVRAGNITRSLKEIIRKAEGVSVSPQRLTPRSHDPSFRELFNPPDTSPCPPFKKPGLPKSRSAHSYLSDTIGDDENDLSKRMKYTTAIEAN